MPAKRPAHDAIVEPSGGAAYDGSAGQTRLERVHLVQRDGSVSTVEVYRVVNVATHPELKARVLAGQLHRLADGRELAVPFVYHDPAAAKFALVIPPVLAHLELKEWSALMSEVAQDTEHAVPAYVRDSTTVLGIGALELFLEADIEPDDDELEEVEAPARSARTHELHERELALTEREKLLDEREREVQDQEGHLMRMAQSLTERENSLLKRRDQLEAERKRARVAAADRDEPHDHDAQVVADSADGEWQEVGLEAEAGRRAAAPDAGADRAKAGEPEAERERPQEVVDDEVEELPASAPQSARPPAGGRTSGPPPLKRRSSGATPPPLRHGHLSAPALPTSLPGHSLAPNDSASRRRSAPPNSARPGNATSTQPPSPGGRGTTPPPLPAGRTKATPQVAPPSPFWSLAPGEMAVRLERDELWLFVHQREGAQLVAPASAELLLQYHEVQGYPVVLLTLVDLPEAPRYVARAALDGGDDFTHDVLRRLERAYKARLAVYDDGSYTGTHEVSSLRETLARAMLERLSRPRTQSRSSPGEALDRALGEPPPVYDPELPFGPVRPLAATTASVRQAVLRLEHWMQPERLEHAMLGLSVPRHVVEASARRVLRAAQSHGVALSPSLAERAVALGVAEDGESLVRAQIEAFAASVEHGDNDLDPQDTAQNWQQLCSQAEALQLPVEARVRALAGGASGGWGGAAEAPAEAQRLQDALGDPEARAAAILELCQRGDAAPAAIVAVLDELPPAEVAAAVAQLLLLGDRASDGLIGGLSSPNPHVRHACALGLGQLKQRRALMPLLKQLQEEPSESWTEMARALGGFGPAALRPLTQALAASAHRERLMLALAHVANHGGLFEVENLEKGDDAACASVARQALARRTRMEWEDQAVRHQRPLRDNSPEARFSQVFFGELAKLSP